MPFLHSDLALQLDCVGWPNGELQIDNSKCSSRNDYTSAQDLTLLNNQ